MYKEITVPYGHETVTLRIPAANLAWVVGPRDVPSVDDLPAAVRAAIRSPIGSMSHMAVTPDGNVCGISSEAVARILPASHEVERIADEGGRLIASDADGALYFARDAQLWRLR